MVYDDILNADSYVSFAMMERPLRIMIVLPSFQGISGTKKVPVLELISYLNVRIICNCNREYFSSCHSILTTNIIPCHIGNDCRR